MLRVSLLPLLCTEELLSLCVLVVHGERNEVRSLVLLRY